MRIFVTGANGFVGSAFMSWPGTANTEFVGLVRGAPGAKNQTTTDYSVDHLAKLFSLYPPDVVIHAAGSASVGLSIREPETDRKNSVDLVSNVLNAMRSVPIAPRFAYVSSAAVYGNPEKLPVRETDPTLPISPYGLHRLKCEGLASEYGALTKTNSIIFRAFSLFGKTQRQLVLWEIAKQAITDNSIVFQGSGLESRDFLSADAFVEKCMRVICMHPATPQTLNIASGESTSIADLAARILQILSIEKPITRLNKPQNGNPTHWAASTESYQSLTGDRSKPNFEQDLASCLQAWKSDLLNIS